MLTILTNLIRYNPLVYSYEIFRIATFINNLIQTSTFFNINWNFPLPSLSTSFKVIKPFRVKEIMQRLNLVVDSIALFTLHSVSCHIFYHSYIVLFSQIVHCIYSWLYCVRGWHLQWHLTVRMKRQGNINMQTTQWYGMECIEGMH